MKLATATLKSISDYSQSRYHDTPKMEKESAPDYEQRTWRERMHIDTDGNVFIPPMAFKNCLSEAAKYLSVQIPGKGKATYTKHIEAGVLVVDALTLDLKKNDVESEMLFLPSDGRRGGGTRVKKWFPLIREWGGDVLFHVFDDTVTEEVFEYHLKQAGQFIGVGRFRPRNNGYYGRFSVEKVEWSEAA